MRLTLNEEQQLLQDSAREFFQANAPLSQLRDLRDRRDPLGYSPELWKEMVQMGWSGVIFPEAYGGLNFGYSGLGLVLTESGRTLAASPLFASIALCGTAVLSAGSEAQKKRWLPPLINGELCFALALEEGRHHDPAQIALRAKRDGKDFVLDGDKVFVLDGHSADQLIVAARTDDGAIENALTLFVVDPQTPGIERRRTTLIDSRNAADISFQSARVAGAQMLGELGGGYGPLQETLDKARIMLAAEMLGSAEEVFTRTIAYLKEREQFGAKIGSYQALQHRAAHLFSELETVRSVVLAAQSSIDSPEEGRPLDQFASLTKAKLNDFFELAAAEAVQMHGGVAMTDEFDIGFFLKRARTTIGTLGSTPYHTDRFASLNGF